MKRIKRWVVLGAVMGGVMWMAPRADAVYKRISFDQWYAGGGWTCYIFCYEVPSGEPPACWITCEKATVDDPVPLLGERRG